MPNKTCFYKNAYTCLFFNYCGNVTLLIKREQVSVFNNVLSNVVINPHIQNCPVQHNCIFKTPATQKSMNTELWNLHCSGVLNLAIFP